MHELLVEGQQVPARLYLLAHIQGKNVNSTNLPACLRTDLKRVAEVACFWVVGWGALPHHGRFLVVAGLAGAVHLL